MMTDRIRFSLHRILPSWVLLSWLLVLATPALAQAEPRFKLRGFATLGAVHSSEDQADFVASPFQPRGAGFSRDWDAGVDSKLALQLDAALNEQWSAVLQVVSQRRHDGSFTPQVEWANIKYQVTPDFSLRAGRTLLATFIASDTRLLGYGNPWVRPPLEVYGLLPVTNTDGVDGTYRFRVGSSTHSTQLSLGGTELDLPGNGKIKASDIVGLNHSIERGALTVRGGFLRAQVDVSTPDLEALFAQLTQFGSGLSMTPGLEPVGAQALALVERYRFDNRRITAATIGAIYDPGDWLLIAEWGRLDGPEVLADSSTWQITGGLRFGNFTPYLSYARRHAEPADEPGIDTRFLPPPLAQPAAALNAGLQQTLVQLAASQRTASVGLRWEVRPNAALKLQFDRVDRESGSAGTFVNLQPGFRLGGESNLISLSLDLVF